MRSISIVRILLVEVIEKSLVIVKKIVKARYDFFHDPFPDVEKKSEGIKAVRCASEKLTKKSVKKSRNGVYRFIRIYKMQKKAEKKSEFSETALRAHRFYSRR